MQQVFQKEKVYRNVASIVHKTDKKSVTSIVWNERSNKKQFK